VRNVRGRSIRVGPMAASAPVDYGDAPINPYREALYTATELYGDGPYDESLDARAYAWSREVPTPQATLAEALHDHAIDEALTRWLRGRRLVGVMGGHDLDRSSAGYADAARLGWMLGQSQVVATGGGPGAMEAANLGARLAGAPRDTVAAAVASLSGVPSHRPSVDQWAAKAGTVVEGLRGVPDRDTLGVPTWFYGHEPTNLFATAIAKYFRNATREAILLQICAAGIAFLPGAGGTVQEIFQDACENYYAAPDAVAPMVLVGTDYWTEILPAWPLLRSLARGRVMERHVHLVETVDDAAAFFSPGGHDTRPA
jgi:predicted Rossmann-fold nucleotide-binding protein